MSSLTQAILFLSNTFFGLAIMLVLLRFLMQVHRVDFYNPFSQMIVKITNPCLIPLRRLIPGFKGYDLSSLFLALMLSLLQACVTLVLFYGGFSIISLVLLSIAQILSTLTLFYFYSILLLAILSFVSPVSHHPVIYVVEKIVSPIINPFRRIVPIVSGFDFSPMLVLIAIKLFEILFINQLYRLI